MEIIIGKGVAPATSVICWESKDYEMTMENDYCSLYKNSVCYEINLPMKLNGSGIRVFRDTDEGKEIDRYLSLLCGKSSSDDIDNTLNKYLLGLFFKNASPINLMKLLDVLYRQGIVEGKTLKEKEIKQVLNIF